MDKKDIRNASKEEIIAFLAENKEKTFRAKQIWEWIWEKGINSFEEMNNISRSTKEILANNWEFKGLKAENIQTANDGTTKTAWKLFDGYCIESVLIPMNNNKFTVCVSCQAGCKLACKFCATGQLGYIRDLSIGEIFEQITEAKKEAEKRGSVLSNIVFMGMGEPMLNLNNLLKTIDHITAKDGLKMSPYRITVSTAGIPEGIKRLADLGIKFNLAVSLHSANNKIRSSLMPINNKYPLEELADALKYFVEKTGNRPTFEYLLMKNINDSLEDAKELALYCKQFPVKINIIEYNNVEGSEFKKSPDRNRREFVKYLEDCNMVVNVRISKGRDIDAACGQLANKNEKNLNE